MVQNNKVFELINKEKQRQFEGLELIASENYASEDVLQCMGSILTNKYSEGYPGKRYYNGNQFIDEIEIEAIERAKNLFKVNFANVQPYSGSPANLAVCFALLNLGDTVMGMSLDSGGHLTHGFKVS
ncbi:MAG TPA: serine hydroxymethyltransferase, partial [Candidatus Dojkabacteria bacterium]|nr:serine hydroxymethyltransferase [Candidatus Dojkabacteria bacterium]